jgi:hypothetical protein
MRRGCHSTVGTRERKGSAALCIIASGIVFRKKRGELHAQAPWGPAAGGTLVDGNGREGRCRLAASQRPRAAPPPNNLRHPSHWHFSFRRNHFHLEKYVEKESEKRSAVTAAT